MAPAQQNIKPVAAWIEDTGEPVPEVLDKDGAVYRLKRDGLYKPRLIIDFGINIGGYIRLEILSSSGPVSVSHSASHWHFSTWMETPSMAWRSLLFHI